MEVVASLSQGRTAAAQCGLFTHKSVPVIFEPPCTSDVKLKKQDAVPPFPHTPSGNATRYVYLTTKLKPNDVRHCSDLRLWRLQGQTCTASHFEIHSAVPRKPVLLVRPTVSPTARDISLYSITQGKGVGHAVLVG